MAAPEFQALTISETVAAIRVGGDMIFEGFKAGWQEMKQPPYVPSLDQLASRIRERTGFDELSEDQRAQLLIKLATLYQVMADRAGSQVKLSGLPDLGKAIGEDINSQLPHEDRINPNKMGVNWGLLTLVLMAKGKTYEKIAEVTIEDRKTLGFLRAGKNPFFGHLSAVRLSGKGTRLTIQHEDAHAFQRETGAKFRVPDFEPFIASDAMLRLVEGKHEPEDVDIALQALEAIFQASMVIIDREFAPHLWSHQLVDLATIRRYLQPLLVVTIALDNYAISCPLDRDKLCFALYPRLKQVAINRYLRIHSELAKAALGKYPGKDGHAWECVAARASALPVNSSLRLKERVLLGDRQEGFKRPELDWPRALAPAFVVYASHKADPEIYDRSRGRKSLLPERIHEFQEILAQNLQDPFLYADVISLSQATTAQWESLKAELVKQGATVVPAGNKSEFRAEMARTLGAISPP